MIFHTPPLRISQTWPFRAYIVDGEGGLDELMIVRGLDGGPGCPAGLRMFHLFGPANQPLPERIADLMVTPVPEHCNFKVMIYRDDFGTVRYTPPYQLAQTVN